MTDQVSIVEIIANLAAGFFYTTLVGEELKKSSRSSQIDRLGSLPWVPLPVEYQREPFLPVDGGRPVLQNLPQQPSLEEFLSGSGNNSEEARVTSTTSGGSVVDHDDGDGALSTMEERSLPGSIVFPHLRTWQAGILEEVFRRSFAWERKITSDFAWFLLKYVVPLLPIPTVQIQVRIFNDLRLGMHHAVDDVGAMTISVEQLKSICREDTTSSNIGLFFQIPNECWFPHIPPKGWLEPKVYWDYVVQPEVNALLRLKAKLHGSTPAGKTTTTGKATNQLKGPNTQNLDDSEELLHSFLQQVSQMEEISQTEASDSFNLVKRRLRLEAKLPGDTSDLEEEADASPRKHGTLSATIEFGLSHISCLVSEDPVSPPLTLWSLPRTEENDFLEDVDGLIAYLTQTLSHGVDNDEGEQFPVFQVIEDTIFKLH